MTCQHCGKSLYEALRQGCCESPCKPVSEDFGEDMLDPFDLPEDSERASVEISKRFNVVFNGERYYVVDKEGGWYRKDTKKAAHEAALDWNYQWEAMLDGKS